MTEIRKYELPDKWGYAQHCFRLCRVIRWQIVYQYGTATMYVEVEADNVAKPSVRETLRDIIPNDLEVRP